MKRICLITEEFAGINKSGGIGACARGLALKLASLGHSVDVLITDLHMSQMIQKDEAISALNVYRLIDIASVDEAADYPIDATTKSHSVYRFLKTTNYDILHFNEWLGTGFYTALAKRQGSISSIIVTHLHGSSEWVIRFQKIAELWRSYRISQRYGSERRHESHSKLEQSSLHNAITG